MTLFSSGLGRTSLGVPYKDSSQLIITWVWRNLWIQCIEWYWNTNSSIARVSFENRIDAKSFLNSLARLRMNKWMNNSIINSGILMCQIFFSLGSIISLIVIELGFSFCSDSLQVRNKLYMKYRTFRSFHQQITCMSWWKKSQHLNKLLRVQPNTQFVKCMHACT